MANPQYKDASGGSNRYRKVDGNSGAVGDPDVFVNKIQSITAGASLDLGTTTDPAVTTDSDGSHSSFLRGIVKLLATIFPTSRGQKNKAGSLSVAISSDDALLDRLDDSHSLGGVKNNGPFWTPKQAADNNLDIGGSALAITPAPDDPTKGIMFDDLSISVAGVSAATLITVREVSGANLANFYVDSGFSGPLPLPLTNGLRASANKAVEMIADNHIAAAFWASWHEETPLP